MVAKRQGLVETRCLMPVCQMYDWYIVKRFQPSLLFEKKSLHELLHSVTILDTNPYVVLSFQGCKTQILRQKIIDLLDVCVLVVQFNAKSVHGPLKKDTMNFCRLVHVSWYTNNI